MTLFTDLQKTRKLHTKHNNEHARTQTHNVKHYETNLRTYEPEAT